MPARRKNHLLSLVMGVFLVGALTLMFVPLVAILARTYLTR